MLTRSAFIRAGFVLLLTIAQYQPTPTAAVYATQGMNIFRGFRRISIVELSL